MCTGMEVALLAGTAISAGAQVQQGREAKAMGNYQAAQAAADADAERGAARAYAEKIRKAGDMERGKAQAALAASGASLDSGSADEIDSNLVSAYEEDALVAMFGGENRARSRMAEGQSARLAGSRAQRNAMLEAAGTAARGWYGYERGRADMARTSRYDEAGLDSLIESRTRPQARGSFRWQAPREY